MATRRDGGRRREGLTAEENSGEDWLSTLPDEILHNVLSFLPAHEAVWTCLLSRRWRNLWRSAPVLRIRHRWVGVERFNKFVNNLLLLRDPVPLDELEFQTYTYWPTMMPRPCIYEVKYAELWIRHALMCKARVLRVLVQSEHLAPLELSMPLISKHLTTLQLRSVKLDNHALDFSNCPVLEDLQMNCCLISLRLGDNYGSIPLLESMPLLVTASVKFGTLSWGCRKCRYDPGTCVCCDGDPDGDGSVKYKFFRGLSNAANLELVAEAGMQDLTWCPTFSKLKTLLLDGWVVGHNFCALGCFLQQTSILEKLTLQLYKGHEDMVEIEESSSSIGQLVQFQNLERVKVRCLRNEEWVHKVFKILNACGVSPDKITIQHYIYIINMKQALRFSNSSAAEVSNSSEVESQALQL
ncbi:Os11g0200300 [Oryza sativa Japonica Group]|uniref:Os11g0200300 protein n=1 Tax=Oryza sativa subsp. japonica TaxID=39947 RepID=C7J8P3_ORYSJ|nr:Os11g0200300 [Oryza sativa Japonica Group]|eukprot:NP_001176404.1 Os11g0200300 [Oryza sativa Japonica Group]